MFKIYNYYRQYNEGKQIPNYKDFYKKFSNDREFGGDFSHYDHLVKHRFMNIIGHVWNIILRKNPHNILDMGCGNGSNLPLSKIFPFISYHGLDYAEKALQNARMQYPDVTFHAGDAFKTEFYDKTFDMIILSNVLILYDKEDDRLKLFSEISRILNDKGVFVLVVYNESCLLKKSIQLSRLIGKLLQQNLPKDFDGVYFNKREIKELAEKAHFAITESIFTGHLYGILESVRYLNMSKYNRKFGKSEGESKKEHPQNILRDLQRQAGHLKWLTSLFYLISKINPKMFAHYSIYTLCKWTR